MNIREFEDFIVKDFFNKRDYMLEGVVFDGEKYQPENDYHPDYWHRARLLNVSLRVWKNFKGSLNE